MVEEVMLFMVIERYRTGQAAAIYRRFEEKGRMLPDGLTYIDSWVTTDMEQCFQLMECDEPRLLDAWMERWSDLVAFESVAVVSSAEAARMVK